MIKSVLLLLTFNMFNCNRLQVPQLSPPYPCFQLQLYLSSAAMVHRRRLGRRHRHQPFAPYLMYLYHFISIDLESSRSCNSTHCKAYTIPSSIGDTSSRVNFNPAFLKVFKKLAILTSIVYYFSIKVPSIWLRIYYIIKHKDPFIVI